MSLTYTTYVSQLANLTAYISSDTSFTTMLPGCIDYAEQRIYRELDLLTTRLTDNSGTLTANVRTFTLPTIAGTFVVVEEVNAITPAGTLSSAGTRNPLAPVSKDWIDAVYPSAVQYTGLPTMFAMKDQTTIIVGPSPSAAYSMEVVGTIRPTPLSSSNATTYLTTYLPDLFMAASMVFASGFMRDFGAQADNPQQAQSWENQFKTLVASAGTEENRKKFFAEGWTSQNPSPIATPKRV